MCCFNKILKYFRQNIQINDKYSLLFINMTEKALLTGGAGFIGHQAIKKILENSDWEILTLIDCYAGNLKRIDDIYEEVEIHPEKD